MMTAAHLQFQTKLSREGKLDMTNRKPFRTAEQKAVARQAARKDKDGTYRTDAPVSYHREVKA